MMYFAYGSNCNPLVMERKKVRFVSRRRAVLSGYRLLFSKKSLRPGVPAGVGYANIHLDSRHFVEGILYEIVPGDLPNLDASERYPDHYTRIEVCVESETGPVPCSAYQAQPDKIAEGLLPLREYLDHLLAARDFFTAEYYAALAANEIHPEVC